MNVFIYSRLELKSNKTTQSYYQNFDKSKIDRYRPAIMIFITSICNSKTLR